MTRPSKSSSAKQPTALPQLAEFPSRQFYTLNEAAAELNRLYGRTDIDENYILQLASMGKIAIQWYFDQFMENIFLIPFNIIKNEKFISKDDESLGLPFLNSDGYILQDNFINLTYNKNSFFIDLGIYGLEQFIFEDEVSSNSFSFKNIYRNFDQEFMISDDFFNTRPKDDCSITFNLFELSIENQRDFIKNVQWDASNDRINFQGENIDEVDGERIFNLEYFRHDVGRLAWELKKEIKICKSELYVLGYDINLIKQGSFRNRKILDWPSLRRSEQENLSKQQLLKNQSFKEFRASKAASAIALLCLHKNLNLDNHSTFATQLLARLPETLTELIGSTSMIDMLREAKEVLERIEKVQAAEMLHSKNQSKLD